MIMMLLGACLWAALAVSCLANGGQQVSLNNYPGVVSVRNDSTYIYLKGGDVIYAASGGNAADGDCVIANFTLDYGLSQNADSGRIKGFLTANITGLTSVPQHNLQTTLGDTSSIRADERAVGVLSLNAFIRDYFFLFTTHAADSLPLNFDLSCNPHPAADGAYDLFLRVNAQTDQNKASQPTTQYNAFNFGALGEGTDSLRFRLHYVTGFSGDTAVKWAVTPLYRFGL